jgi:hypothetical protein
VDDENGAVLAKHIDYLKMPVALPASLHGILSISQVNRLSVPGPMNGRLGLRQGHAVLVNLFDIPINPPKNPSCTP